MKPAILIAAGFATWAAASIPIAIFVGRCIAHANPPLDDRERT